MTRDPHDGGASDEAEWVQRHREELEADFDDAEEIVVEVAQPLNVSTSFRMSREEAVAIREAATGAGLSQSEWIRTVCVAAAHRTTAPVAGISAFEARKLRSLLEQAERIVWPATQAG
ncbi:hypothetical protein ABZ805_22575 [Saccharopolyspora sp. NPDC047091]|uniref:plasmid mobilization protein n=1 Tax=Saccharopolyspora sp. NPDC047091 TaxID=3155924 RepID=UPI0033CF5D80